MRAAKIAKRPPHIGRRTGDDRGIKARYARGEESADGVRDLLAGALGIVEIDAQKAVHLNIDESWSDVESARAFRQFDGRDGAVEGHQHRSAAESFNSKTIHAGSALCTG